MEQAAQDFASSLHPVTSIFFGGGTPSLLGPELLLDLLARCRQHFPLAPTVEISLEANPGSVDASSLQVLRQAGFNRLSLGVQSFNEQEVQRLGRGHSAAQAIESVHLARQAGFRNLSLDLMYGLPGQAVQDWQATLEQALDLAPEHLSIYELTVEPGTVFARMGQEELDLPKEEDLLAMLDLTLQRLQQAGYQRYEISNYARDGFQCRHNCNYWNTGAWLGLGPGAVTCLGGTRYSSPADLEGFCQGIEAGQRLWEEEERLSPEAQFREAVIMGLRMRAGLSLADLNKRFGLDVQHYYGKRLERLQQGGWVDLSQGRIRLTQEGLLLANAVMAELV
jgi:oxygen-independent coproporphyrinogen-3 oxidase